MFIECHVYNRGNNSGYLAGSDSPDRPESWEISPGDRKPRNKHTKATRYLEAQNMATKSERSEPTVARFSSGLLCSLVSSLS